MQSCCDRHAEFGLLVLFSLPFHDLRTEMRPLLKCSSCISTCCSCCNTVESCASNRTAVAGRKSCEKWQRSVWLQTIHQLVTSFCRIFCCPPMFLLPGNCWDSFDRLATPLGGHKYHGSTCDCLVGPAAGHRVAIGTRMCLAGHCTGVWRHAPQLEHGSVLMPAAPAQ